MGIFMTYSGSNFWSLEKAWMTVYCVCVVEENKIQAQKPEQCALLIYTVSDGELLICCHSNMYT